MKLNGNTKMATCFLFRLVLTREKWVNISHKYKNMPWTLNHEMMNRDKADIFNNNVNMNIKAK